MKSFSDDEKTYIRQICLGSGHFVCNLQNLLEQNLEGMLMVVDTKARAAVLLVDPPPDPPPDSWAADFLDSLVNIERKTVQLLALITYLEQNGFLVSYSPTALQTGVPPETIFTFGQGNSSNPTHYTIPDPGTVSLIVHFVNRELIPLPSLSSLVKNNFKTDEDIRFGKNQVVTLIGIAVAFLVGIIPTIWTGCDSRSQAKETEEYRHNEAVRWQAFLATESNKVVQVGNMSRILLKVNQSIGSLTNQAQTVTKPILTGGNARKQTVR